MHLFKSYISIFLIFFKVIDKQLIPTLVHQIQMDSVNKKSIPKRMLTNSLKYEKLNYTARTLFENAPVEIQ